jgi:hypothetical protein
MKRFVKFLLIALLLVSQAQATDYVTKTATPTGNFIFSTDIDLGSSDTTISSQNAVKSYVDAHFAPVNGYLLTTRDVPALTNATNLGTLSTGLLKMTVSGGIAVLSTAVDGTDYFTSSSQTANYFYAAPNGSAGLPGFRAIVAADIPSLSSIYQPLDGGLTALAGLTFADASIIQLTGADAAAVLTSAGNNYFLTSASDNSALEFKTPAAALTAIGGQASSATLTSLAGLTETNGGIPYGTADNAYAWLAAGGSGKLLMGAGAAAPIWTTPTFPNAATTTGAYLRADGTNFIQSTLLLPNAGTAYTLAAYTATNTLTELAAVGGTGTILRGASGAIPAWSTSTFADTYAKGTVLHAGTANIITGLAPGAVGSFLMSNGTGQELSYLAAGAANYQLVGAGVTTIPVWTASTGTGSPVLSTGPTFTGTVTLPKTLEIQDTSADHQYVLAVSELTADRTVTLPLLTGADEFVFKDFAQTLTNKTLTAPVLGAATATSINSSVVGWTRTTGTFTATPASTSTITMAADTTAAILVGYPVKYVYDTGGGPVTYYGIITAITSNLMTIAGAPLDTGHDVTALYYGDPLKVRQITYDNSASTSVLTTGTIYTLRWSLPKAYLVLCKYYQVVHDTHATHGKLTIKINGTETNTSAGGVTITADATWYGTVIDIATAAYDVNTDEDITIYATQGGNINGYGARVNMVFVVP